MIPWHDEARKMLAEGHAISRIAMCLGRSHRSVAWALDLDREREKTRDRVRKHRDRFRAKQTTSTRPICGAGADCIFVAEHKYRKPAAVINRSFIAEILSSRRGDVSLAELRERLAP